jgi:hypothetical protein
MDTNPGLFYGKKHEILTRITLELIEAMNHVADLETHERSAADPDPEVTQLAETAESLYRHVSAMRCAVDAMRPR